MKKSELINKIKDHLLHYDLDLDDEELDDEAYCLLSIIEKAGMQPPMSPNWEWTKAPWNKDDLDFGYTVKYTWESEDEKV